MGAEVLTPASEEGEVTVETAPTEIAWEPQEGPQTALLECPVEDIFFGGARGGGKTDGLLGDFAEHASKYGKAARGILFRRTYPELEEVERRAREIYTPVGAIYNATSRTWAFPNGATLRLRYLERESDADKYQGHQYTWMGFDELQHWPTSRPIDRLWGALRSAHGVPCVRRSSGNPGGVGHQWIKARYIDAARPWHTFKYRPQPDRDDEIEAVFIPSFLEDNPALYKNDPQYERRLAAVGGPELYRAWRYGDWSITAGQAFEIGPAHLIRSFLVPKHFTMFGSLDIGYAHWWVFTWFAVNEDGRVFVVGNTRGRRMRDTAIIKQIKDVVPWQRLDYIVAGHDCWNKDQKVGGPSTEERFAKADLFLRKAEIDRVPGVRQLREYLAWKGIGPKGEDDDASLVWLDSKSNRRQIEAMQSMVMDPDKPEDVLKVDAHGDTGVGGDDDYDCVRYGMMSRPRLAVETWRDEAPFDAFSQEALQAEMDQQRRSKRPKPKGGASWA